MAAFEYTARDKQGQITKGSIYANDRASASAIVIGKGLAPILIKESSGTASGPLQRLKQRLAAGSKVKLDDKVVFSRQFATMINAGVPIAKSLSILKDQTASHRLQEVIADVAKKVESGNTLASALADHPDVFSSVYINMIKAGEAGGILDQVLERLAIQQEKDAEIVSKVKGAMIYPGVITSVTIAAFVFLMTVIVPKLATIFEGVGADLPIYTKLLLAISTALTKYGWLVAIVAGGLGVSLFKYAHTPGGKRNIDRLLLKLPVFGKIIQKVNVARFARTFGSLMASGISVLEALKATASALGNSTFQEEIMDVAKQVKNGKQISDPLRQSANFPPIVAQMISVGEETGELDGILLKLAEFYEKEVDTIVGGITSIIEPILIMVIGGMIGFIIISVFGPLSQLSNTF